jgi:hypothetical protein
VAGGNNAVAMLIDARREGAEPGTTASGGTDTERDATAGTSGTGTGATGTSGAAAGNAAPALTSVAELERADEAMVGRPVRLANVEVAHVARDGGFFVGSGDSTVFVLPHDRPGPTVQAGESVTVSGRVFQMPDAMERRLDTSRDAHARINGDVYVFATSVRK